MTLNLTQTTSLGHTQPGQGHWRYEDGIQQSSVSSKPWPIVALYPRRQLSTPQTRSSAQWELTSQSPSPLRQPPCLESQHESPPKSFHKWFFPTIFFSTYQSYRHSVARSELGKPADLGRDDNVQGDFYKKFSCQKVNNLQGVV